MKNILDRIKEFVKNHKLPSIITLAVVLFAVVLTIVLCNINKSKKTSVSEADSSIVETETSTKEEKETEKKTEKQTEKNTTEKSTEETENKFTKPLTGEVSNVDYSSIRPVSIMVNTVKNAMPQIGVSEADVIIEMKEEGGITRVMALYQDLTGVGIIGTIRSTREYYYSWIKGFDGIMVHAGGDSWVLNKIKSDGYASLDWLTNAGNSFWRDEERKAIAGSEHSLLTSSDLLQVKIAELGMSTVHTTDNYTKFNFAKDSSKTTAAGQPANAISVVFSGYKDTSFVYNPVTGKYDVSFWGTEYVDAGNNERVSVKNVIILPVPNWEAKDAWGKVRQKYDMSGGVGYYCCEGKFIEINWAKGNYENSAEYGNPLILTNTDGSPLELGVGKTYICVPSAGNPIGIE